MTNADTDLLCFIAKVAMHVIKADCATPLRAASDKLRKLRALYSGVVRGCRTQVTGGHWLRWGLYNRDWKGNVRV